MSEVSARLWTQAILRVDRHSDECRKAKTGCHKPNESGYPACVRARRLMRGEERARNAYRKAGGRMPPE